MNTQDGIFLAELDKAIVFHATNTNDPHNVGNAVLAALVEVKNAFKKSRE